MSFTLATQFRDEIKDLKVCAKNGERAKDDLHLEGMARLALNYLRGNPDPQRAYECKFALGPLGIPCHVPISPPNKHGFDVVSLGDTDSRMDMQFAHMRQIVGEPIPDPAESGVRRRVLGYMRKDHLCWLNPGAAIGETIDEEWASPWTTAKLLYSVSEAYQRTGDKACHRMLKKIFKALKDIALWDGKRAYYWGCAPCKQGRWLIRKWTIWHSRNYPFIVEPLMRYYECTGDEEGLALAQSFADGFLDGIQPEMGAQRVDPANGKFHGHVHLHTHGIWGVAHLGAALGDKRYLDWARKVHDFVVSIGTDYGWYPENSPQGNRAELCVVGDMASIGAWIARGGHPQYWDVVERTVRNLIRKAQFSLTPEFVRLFEHSNKAKSSREIKAALRSLKAIEGGFVAQPAFNDWVSYPDNPKLGTPGMYSNGIHMMGCCPPEGMRALWEAWNGVVEVKAEGVFINLPISREHAMARVIAFSPEDGAVEVVAKGPGDFFIRPPSWSERAYWKISVNGTEEPVMWGGPAQAYVVRRKARKGDRLLVSWQALEFTQAMKPKSMPDGDEILTIRWTGNKVRAVSPKGKYLPMF